MANVYYYNYHGGFAYTNDPEAPACTLYEWNPDNPVSDGHDIYIKLTNDTFIFPEDATGLFYGCTNEVFNDMESWDTSDCTNMSYLFAECRNLKSSGQYYNLETFMLENGWFSTYFDTSNVTDMSHMFDNCLSLDSLSLSTWDTSKVTDFSWMFGVSDIYEAQNVLDHLNIGSFDTSSATNMEGMFSGCRLRDQGQLDLSNWDTSKVTNMEKMFTLIEAAPIISSFDTSSCTNMRSMFSGSIINSLDISHFDTSKADCSYMFSNCGYLEELNIGEFDLSSTQDIADMFGNCINLTTVTAAPGTDWTQYQWQTSNPAPFEGCTKITNWDGDKTLTHANNTKNGGYFGVGIKTWTTYLVYMKV